MERGGNHLGQNTKSELVERISELVKMPNKPTLVARPMSGVTATATQVRYILGLCRREKQE
eukprot:10996763-Alexandrium_andersonii.AAC.1